MVQLDYRDKEHFRIKFYKNEFIICKNRISGIDYFWACAEDRLYFIKINKKRFA